MYTHMMFFHGCQINNVWKNNSLILKSARSALWEYVSLVLIIHVPTLTMLLMVRAVPTAPVVAKA